ncbi:MAG: hypothetical protein PHT59_02460 [Candidatus Omnitrophica bacterium]|nr:hypothetical protein [Candidatus Omnitrophota bacterium]
MEELFAKVKQLDKQKLMMLGVGIGVVVVLDVAFVMQMQFKSAGYSLAKIAELKRTISDIQNRAREVAFKKQEKGKESIKPKNILGQAELPLLLQEITTLAKVNNVKLVQIVHSKEGKPAVAKQTGRKGPAAAAPATLTPVRVKLDLVCGFHNLGAFIDALENAPEPLSCEDFKISRSGEFQKERVSLSIRTFIKE